MQQDGAGSGIGSRRGTGHLDEKLSIQAQQLSATCELSAVDCDHDSSNNICHLPSHSVKLL
eukprot:504203-Amphidinium_carterae.1